MNRQRSLEQKRAAAAWDKLQAVQTHNQRLPEKKRYAKEYGSLARSAPTDVQASGLGQTLAFWRAKGYDKGKPKENGANAHYQLLEHVSEWLRKRLGLDDDQDIVKWIAKEATTDQYRRATSEAIAFLVWLKRFAEAEIGGE